MQGCGNDYVYIDCVMEQPDIPDRHQLARDISDRHFGVGSDGLIFINKGRQADFEMEMYNSDGSRAEMCGNGIRCVAKYVYDHGMTGGTEFTIESAGKVKYIQVFPEGDTAGMITVDMGEPILSSAEVPVISGMDVAIGEEMEIAGAVYKVTCVSMGNPHAVVFAGQKGSADFDLDSLAIDRTGPLFEHYERFPARINTEFVHVTDRSHMEMRVWERGAGETLACGTGCCATLVAAVLNGLTDREAYIKVLGGELLISWDEATNHIFMTGPAEYVFTGTYEVKG